MKGGLGQPESLEEKLFNVSGWIVSLLGRIKAKSIVTTRVIAGGKVGGWRGIYSHPGLNILQPAAACG